MRGGWSSHYGGFARGEVGAHLRPNLGVFGFGELSRAEKLAGIGARFTW